MNDDRQDAGGDMQTDELETCAERLERFDAEVKHATERACSAWDAFVGITSIMDEHPEDWDGPCFCKICMSYNDG